MKRRSSRSPFDTFASQVARFILGAFFVYSGLDNLMDPNTTAEMINFPAPVLLVIIGGAFKIVAGTALALRYHTKYAAISLAAYILVVSLVFYGPQHWERFEIYQYIFMRNMAIFAGLIFIEAHSRGTKLWQEVWIPESQRDLLKEDKRHRPPHP